MQPDRRYFPLGRGKTMLLTLCLPVFCCAAPPELPTLEQLLNTRLHQVKHQLDVETSARSTQNSQQQGNLTYVLTANDIRSFGMQTLADILGYFPGLYISKDPAFSYVGIRGLGQPSDYNTRLLFLLDGVRMNEAIFDAGLLGTDALIDVEDIDRVEFSAGPGAAVYGNNAFFGVIQLFSKKAAKQGLSTDVQLGTLSTSRYRLSGASRFDNGNELYGSVSHQNTPELPLGVLPPAQLQAQYEALSFEHINRLRLGGKVSGLQFQLLHSEQKRSGPAVLPWQDEVRLASLADLNRGAQLALQYQITGELWDASLNASLSQNLFRRSQPVLAADTQQADALVADQRSQWSGLSLISQYYGWRHHQWLAGYERHQDHYKDVKIQLRSTGQLLQELPGSQLRQSWFVQDTWAALRNHYLSFGLRLDDSQSAPDHWSPRLSWSWQAQTETTLKLQYGRAFRAANHYESATNQTFSLPPLQDEQIKSSELSAEHLLRPDLGLRLTLFRAKVTDLIVLRDYFVNAPPLNSKGSELSLDWRDDQGRQLNIAWSWQRSAFADQPLLNSPKHLLQLRFQQPLLLPTLHLSLSVQSRSGRLSSAQYLPGYAHWQAGLLWQASPTHQLGLQLQNVLDKAYQHQPLAFNPPLWQPQRQLWLQWRWQQ